jgi:hypothetical protein
LLIKNRPTLDLSLILNISERLALLTDIPLPFNFSSLQAFRPSKRDFSFSSIGNSPKKSVAVTSSRKRYVLLFSYIMVRKNEMVLLQKAIVIEYEKSGESDARREVFISIITA